MSAVTLDHKAEEFSVKYDPESGLSLNEVPKKKWGVIQSLALKSLFSVGGGLIGGGLGLVPFVVAVVWVKTQEKGLGQVFVCIRAIALLGPIVPLGAIAGARAGNQIANGILNQENRVELFYLSALRATCATFGGGTVHIASMVGLALLMGSLEALYLERSHRPANGKAIAKFAMTILWTYAGAKMGDHLSKHLISVKKQN